jgi:CRP-like cAMP-binding protein
VLINYSENCLLASLPPEDFESLRRHFRNAVLAAGSILFDAGDVPSKAYFPHGGAVSRGIVLANGHMIETALVGRDGMLGGLPWDGEGATCRAMVQIEAAASVIDAELLRQLAKEREGIAAMLWRHERLLLLQTQRTAACNASHSLEERLCRWLLRASDACGKTALSTTQDTLAELLGVKRTSVSLIAHGMQEAGLIRTRRGQIEILDLNGLRENACECYANTAAQYGVLPNKDAGPAERLHIA